MYTKTVSRTVAHSIVVLVASINLGEHSERKLSQMTNQVLIGRIKTAESMIGSECLRNYKFLSQKCLKVIISGLDEEN